MNDQSSISREKAEDASAIDKNRPLRSFVLRKGRLTAAQSRALDELMPTFGLACEGEPIDIPGLFGRSAPLVVEIGFGNGEATWRMAAAEPHKNFIGIEVHAPGVGHLLLALEKHGLQNVRIARCDAVPFMQRRLKRESVAELRIYFPDPWPKKRHHKRRIIQPGFVSMLEKILEPGGLVHIATDWPPYVEHINEVFDAAENFDLDENTGAENLRPETKYEQRGQRLGHPIKDLVFRFRHAGASSR